MTKEKTLLETPALWRCTHGLGVALSCGEHMPAAGVATSGETSAAGPALAVGLFQWEPG